jgi:anti-sigma regulatory factor (Ser/Thr protein kinase)
MVLPQTPPRVRLSLAGRAAPRAARRAVELVIGSDERWKPLLTDALLATSELVTNSIQAAGECSLSIWFQREDGALRVEVSDASPGRPRVRRLDEGRVGGHGLRIVADVSTRWGVEESRSAKAVWFEIVTD